MIVKCFSRTYNQRGFSTCQSKASLEYRGQWYCRTHHPPTQKAKWDARVDANNAAREAKNVAYRAEMKERNLAARALEYMREYLPHVVAAWGKEP